MIKMKLPIRLLLAGLVMCLSLAHYQPAVGQSGYQFFISDLDCSAFPTISLLVRGLDAGGDVISSDLLPNSFSLFEGDQPVESVKPIGSEEGPKYVVFSFDLGKYSNLDDLDPEIRDALLTYALNYFKENRDTVQFASHTNSGRQELDLTTPTKSLEELKNGIDNLLLLPSSEQLVGLLGLEDLYTRLQGLDPGRYSMVIVHFSRFVEGITPPQAVAASETLGKELAAKNIRVYAFHTDIFQASKTAQPLQILAAQSRGEYVHIGDARLRQSKIMDVFNQIKRNAQSFRIQFQARQLNATYSVAPTGVSQVDATDRQACPGEVTLPAPVVQITQPGGENPAEFLRAGQATIQVKAALQDWPSDGSRRIERAELLVDNGVVEAQDFPADFSGMTFTFSLAVPELQPGGSTTLQLQVRVTDQFKMVGSASTVLTVYANVEATTGPVETPFVQVIPTLSPVCQDKPWTGPCLRERSESYLKWVVANLIWIMLVLLIIVIIFLFITNRKLAGLASPAREVIARGIDQVRKTILGGTSVRQEAIAYLQVLVARADRTGGRIEIYNNRTSLGRDPKVTDVQLYHLEDESSVSSLHCTIFYEQGKFYITDDNSTNGTHVDGKRLDANEPYELRDGAEIILGDIYREGAKLRFEIAAGVGVKQAEIVAEEAFSPGDFNVDIPLVEETQLPERAPKDELDDFRKTVPGYRLEEEEENRTDVFNEPPPAPRAPTPPQPGPMKAPPPKKREKRDWKDDLE